MNPARPTRSIRWRACSYVIEYLTDEIEKRGQRIPCRRSTVWAGRLASIEKGFMQNEIQEAAYQWQRSLENKEQTLVGVNAFQGE